MNKLTARVRHIHNKGQYECMTCSSLNTGIAGECIDRIMVNYSDPIYYNIYKGYCENNCDFTMDMRGDV